MKRLLSAILAIILVFSNVGTSAAFDFTTEESTKASLLGNPENGEIYYQRNIDKSLPVASMSKLMTYLVVKDQIEEGKISSDDQVQITEEVASFNIPGYSRFGLRTGDIVSVEELLLGLMVVSGNDAAHALAIHTGQTVENFVTMMNEKAQELGLENSHFVNPSGLTQELSNPKEQLPPNQEAQEFDEKFEYNSMTARELFELSSHIVNKYPEIEEYGKINEISYPERNYTGTSTFPLEENRARVGLKTGATEEAGYGFVGLFDRSLVDPERDYKVITVVIGANSRENRNLATQELLDYLNAEFIYTTVVSEERPLVHYYDEDLKEKYIPLYPEKTIKRIVMKDKTISISYQLDEDESAPYEKGQTLGQVIILEDGNEAARVDLVTDREYEKLGFFEKLALSIRDFFDNLLLLF